MRVNRCLERQLLSPCIVSGLVLGRIAFKGRSPLDRELVCVAIRLEDAKHVNFNCVLMKDILISSIFGVSAGLFVFCLDKDRCLLRPQSDVETGNVN